MENSLENLYVDIDQMLEGLTILDQHFCKDHFNVHKINFVIALLLQAVLYNRLKNLVLPYRPIKSK